MRRWRKSNSLSPFGPYAALQRDLLFSPITGNAVKVIGVLIMDSNLRHSGEFAQLTLEEISAKSFLSIKTVRSCLDELLRARIIRRRKAEHSFIYEFSSPLCWEVP